MIFVECSIGDHRGIYKPLRDNTPHQYQTLLKANVGGPLIRTLGSQPDVAQAAFQKGLY